MFMAKGTKHFIQNLRNGKEHESGRKKLFVVCPLNFKTKFQCFTKALTFHIMRLGKRYCVTARDTEGVIFAYVASYV